MMGGLEGPPKPPALRVAAEPRRSASAVTVDFIASALVAHVI